MSTTYTAFCNALADLSVTGVTTKQRYIPDRAPTANLPLQFVRLPEGAEMGITQEGEGGWPTLIAELVIVVEPLRQNRNAENQALTVTLIDNLTAALRAVTPGQVCKSKLRWRIRGEQRYLGETEYWLLVARIEGNG